MPKKKILPCAHRLHVATAAGHSEWADLPTDYFSGSKFYFTGKPCKRGHYAPRRSCGGACLECTQKSGPVPVVRKSPEERAAANRAYMAAYFRRPEVIERRREYSRKYREAK